MSAATDPVIRIGRITGAHGVKGWVRVHSYTQPRTNLLDFDVWRLEHQGLHRDIEVLAGRESGRKLIAQLAGIDNRDAAVGLTGAEITVRRSDLPVLAADEYYWADLVGLSVINTQGDRLGTVASLIETGANDVLVLDSSEQHLIPFVLGQTVLSVSLADGEIVVDWDRSFWE